jgi:hypothetical protein
LPSIGSKFFLPPELSGLTFDFSGQYEWNQGNVTETVQLKEGGIATFTLQKEGTWEH